MRPAVAFALTLLLAALALALLASRDAVLGLAGLDPLGTPTAAGLDRVADPDDREAPRFLAARDRVRVEVPREMTAGELLALYQIDFPHVRRQIAVQAGVERLGDDQPLAAGARFEITLTPPEGEGR